MRAPDVLTNIDADGFLRRLDKSISALYPDHPFGNGIDRENFGALMGQYAAMSVAFPYIQSGAIYRAYRTGLGRSAWKDNIQISAAVGAFLTWDEFGGHELVMRNGPDGLPGLTEVKRNFHSAMLITDVRKLIGAGFTEALPDRRTADYLDRLYDGLSDPVRNRNIAHMLAFERHAFAMITALYEAIQLLFGADASEGLDYFEAHIGSDSNGEAVHVAMTGRMIEKLIRPDEEADFLEECLRAYAMNHEWCAGLVAASPVPA
ncbi:hypothetical protein QA635_33645 [Bradyrhizobium brasilense]|uniref:hypothetical protein n=1 Tax=Bradyrhizobium brasilense TaxID=1419277 RepID=UPI0024B280B4|nr:hypothetical protein [Bradyrhizobium australafricanum]WFU31432.1 hypothetical protein QA635_33645 [Bradyrhizobium australafricanum]